MPAECESGRANTLPRKAGIGEGIGGKHSGRPKRKREMRRQ